MNIIFHSTISKIGDKYFIKDVFADYLVNLSSKTTVNLITPVVSTRRPFHTQEIDVKGIGLNIVPIPNGFSNKWKVLFGNIKNGEVSLIFMPTYTGVLAAIFSIFLKKKYALYFGTDWSIIREQRSILAHGKIVFKDRLFLRLDKIINSFISKRAKLIFVTGGQLKEKYSRLNSNICETRPIINLKHLSFKAEKVRNDGMFNIIFVGKITKAKGVFDLIEGIKLLDEKLPIKFTIIGDGDAYEELKGVVNKSSLNERVKLLGYIKNGPELFKEYVKSNTFILPSYFEGFPRVLYEAMQFETSIITTPVNSIPYLLEDNQTALFIKVGNPVDIKNTIEKVYKDEALNARLIENGKQLIETILKEPAWEQHLKLLKKI